MNRHPILDVVTFLSYTINREFEPGDNIQFTVQAAHKCDSKATAKNVSLDVYKPVLVSAINRNDSKFLSQMPTFSAPLPDQDYGTFTVSLFD